MVLPSTRTARRKRRRRESRNVWRERSCSNRNICAFFSVFFMSICSFQCHTLLFKNRGVRCNPSESLWSFFFLSHYFFHPFSVLDSRSDTFASSDCWKIQKSLILLQRSAVGRRKREIRTETGEKIHVYADVLVTQKNLTLI